MKWHTNIVIVLILVLIKVLQLACSCHHWANYTWPQHRVLLEFRFYPWLRVHTCMLNTTLTFIWKHVLQYGQIYGTKLALSEVYDLEVIIRNAIKNTQLYWIKGQLQINKIKAKTPKITDCLWAYKMSHYCILVAKHCIHATIWLCCINSIVLWCGNTGKQAQLLCRWQKRAEVRAGVWHYAADSVKAVRSQDRYLFTCFSAVCAVSSDGMSAHSVD